MCTALCDVQRILSNMQDPDYVKGVATCSSNVNPAPLMEFVPEWNDLSLGNGYPSLLLLFSCLKTEEFICDQDAILHRYVLKIKEAIETQGFFDCSLFNGVAGVCFALQQASCGGTRYQKMLEKLHTFLIEQVTQNYLAPLRMNQSYSLPSSPRLYDPIQGICGIGRYVLENLSFSPFVDLARTIGQAVVNISKPLLYKGHSIPGWFISPNDLLNVAHRSACPKGNFNLGLSHGVSGLLAFLSISSLKGIEVDGQQDAIARLANWIRSKALMNAGAIIWPYSVSWEEEIDGKDLAETDSKDAWCYGVPGIARSLLLAGHAAQNEELKTFAINAFYGVFSRKREKWRLMGPSLCHGFAGLFQITREMAKEKGCEDLELKVKELREILLSFYSEDAPWGFRHVEACREGKWCEVDRPGLLEGATGVLLTLTSSSSLWHLPLLLHA